MERERKRTLLRNKAAKKGEKAAAAGKGGTNSRGGSAEQALVTPAAATEAVPAPSPAADIFMSGRVESGAQFNRHSFDLMNRYTQVPFLS